MEIVGINSLNLSFITLPTTLNVLIEKEPQYGPKTAVIFTTFHALYMAGEY